MNNAFTKLGERFTHFFTRSVAPSSIFFVLLYFNDNFFNNSCWFKEFLSFLEDTKSIHDVFLYVCLVLLFLAYGYINQIFSQLLDNFIKKNYDDSDEQFNSLRTKVENKLTEKEKDIFKSITFNDYNAYQVLGNSLKVSTSYVDEVKNIHTCAISVIFNILIYFMLFDTSVQPLLTLCIITLVAITILLFYFFARSRYKARNKRLYINYLLKEDKKDKCEKEIKIKSIKVEVDE